MKSVSIDEEEIIILEKLLSDAENELKRLKLVLRLTEEQQELLDKELDRIATLKIKISWSEGSKIMNIGEKIKKLREEEGLTQKDLSELTGINRITIGNYERGNRVPNIERIIPIANVLNVDANYFIDMNNGNATSRYKETIKQQDKEIESLKKVISKIKDLMEEL